MTELDSLRYPVGRFERLTKPLDAAARRIHVKTIEDTPARFRSLVSGLSDAQLELPYRPGGWTIRQVVHPRARQPSERVHQDEARCDRRYPDDQDIRGAALGRVARSQEWSRSDVARPARGAAPPLGGVHEPVDRRRLRPGVCTPGPGASDDRRRHRHVRVAFPPSRGTYRTGAHGACHVSRSGQPGCVGRLA